MSISYGLVRTTQLVYGSYCTINGCSKKRNSGHRYCNQHKYRLTYRGDANQQRIPVTTQNCAKNAVKLLIKDNQNNVSWHELMSAINERWSMSVAYVQGELDKHLSGKPSDKYRRRGLILTRDIFTNLGLENTFIIYCSWQYLQEWNPNMFVTDDAFKHQLVRSMRNQAKSFHTQSINKKTGKPSSYSSPLYMREREVVWEILTGIFGTTGMQLYKQIEKRAEKLRANKERMYAAIKRIE